MANPLIILSDPTTVISDFNAILNQQHSLFVVLGDSNALTNYANEAADAAEAFRRAVQVTPVSTLYPRLKNLPAENGALPDNPAGVTAVSIAPDKTICDILTDVDPSNIVPAFVLAETH
ncbi:MAG TPA: hypothetical protein VFE32_02715 [Puia sp.]|jgi:hypothetical protein|nr:hypothetical protein [Puia sp.]